MRETVRRPRASQKTTPAKKSLSGAPLELHDQAGRGAQSLLKWAGGKAQLLEQFKSFFPKSVRSYVEPFVGGGAVFFYLKAQFPSMATVLRDNNAELINCYQVVRDELE